MSAVLAHTLMEIDPRYPQVDAARQEDLAETRTLLEAEALKGAAADPARAEIAAEQVNQMRKASMLRLPAWITAASHPSFSGSAGPTRSWRASPPRQPASGVRSGGR